MKDLIIGAVDNYGWDNIKNWISSIKASGFEGDVVLIAYRIADNVIKLIESQGVHVMHITWDSWGKEIVHEQMNRDTQCHQMRFFHIWQFLMSNPDYNNVIITDVRDVVFQTNPSEWLNKNFKYHQIVAPSEGLLFKNEPWNGENIRLAFGSYFEGSLSDAQIYNVGTIAGEVEAIKNLCNTIYLMGAGHQIPNDQAAFNLLVNGLAKDITLRIDMRDNWACQCGTTLDPDKAYLRGSLLIDLPVIENGIVYSPVTKQPYVMVHQYNRVPGLREEINKRFA